MSFADSVVETNQKASTKQEAVTANTRLRVLFVSHTYVVGLNQGKLNAIAETGAVDVGLLAPNQWDAPQWNKQLELETPYPTIQTYPARIWFGGRAGAYFYSPLAVLNAIKDFRPDIIQVEQEVFSLSAFEIALFAKLFSKPLVLFGWENMDRQLSPVRRWIRQFVFKTTQLMLTGNHEGADIMRQWGFKRPIEVMPQMGVDTKIFAPPSSKPVNSKLSIGFVGRLSYHKGIDLLIEAARILRDRNHDFQIVLCGSGSDEATFRAAVEQQNLNDRFVWRGGVRHDEVPQEMAQFDVLVLPSRTVETWKEQFGHVLIEAMAMGIPVVGSTCGEIPNVVGHPDLIFPEGDAIALSRVLERLICESEWRHQAGQHSLDRVHRYYTHERIAQRLIQLWQQILKPERPAFGAVDSHFAIQGSKGSS